MTQFILATVGMSFNIERSFLKFDLSIPIMGTSETSIMIGENEGRPQVKKPSSEKRLNQWIVATCCVTAFFCFIIIIYTLPTVISGSSSSIPHSNNSTNLSSRFNPHNLSINTNFQAIELTNSETTHSQPSDNRFTSTTDPSSFVVYPLTDFKAFNRSGNTFTMTEDATYDFEFHSWVDNPCFIMTVNQDLISTIKRYFYRLYHLAFKKGDVINFVSCDNYNGSLIVQMYISTANHADQYH